MGLLDFVEEHHAKGLLLDGVGELAALVEAHVARWRPDEARLLVLLRVFTHVEPQQRRLVTEHEFSDRLAELRLAHAGRPDEKEGAAGLRGMHAAGQVAKPELRPDEHRHDLVEHVILSLHTPGEHLFRVAEPSRVDLRPGILPRAELESGEQQGELSGRETEVLLAAECGQAEEVLHP